MTQALRLHATATTAAAVGLPKLDLYCASWHLCIAGRQARVLQRLNHLLPHAMRHAAAKKCSQIRIRVGSENRPCSGRGLNSSLGEEGWSTLV